MIDRRKLVTGLGAGLLMAAPARAQGFGQLYPLESEDHNLIPNFRVPPTFDPSLMRGVIHVGSTSPDVTIYEFFDYRCPYCRAAVPIIDKLLGEEKGLALGLINNPILSQGSIGAARVQQAVLKYHGDEVAYAMHRKLFSVQAPDASIALLVAQDLGLDTQQLQAAADSDQIKGVVARQMRLASDLGMTTTPSFVVDGVGLIGWPGEVAMRRIVDSVRSCDRPICSK